MPDIAVLIVNEGLRDRVRTSSRSVRSVREQPPAGSSLPRCMIQRDLPLPLALRPNPQAAEREEEKMDDARQAVPVLARLI